MDSFEAVLDFRLPPQPHLSRMVRADVTEFARTHGVCDDDLTDFLIALGEALANAVEHARAEAPVEIEVRIASDRIVATVADSGVGFPGDTIAAAAFPEFAMERGRGLPIMKSCCDIFAVTTEPGKGTAVVLGRYLRGRRAVAVA